MLSDLEALAAAFGTLIVILIGVAFSRRVFSPGPMFNPEGFARLLVAEILMQNKPRVGTERLKADIERSRAVFLSRFPNDGAVYDAAVKAIVGDGA